MHALQTNYYFRISIIHYPRLQTTLMLTPPKQHKLTWEMKHHFEILNNADQTETLFLIRKTFSISCNLNWTTCFSILKLLIILWKLKTLKTEIVSCGKVISLALLRGLYNQNWNDRKARQRKKERLQIIFPELLFLSYSKNIP